jgi:hypothetical protein
MLPSQRLHQIRALQLDVSKRERRHAPRSEQRRELKLLVVKQLKSEMRWGWLKKILGTTTGKAKGTSPLVIIGSHSERGKRWRKQQS